MNSVDLSVVIPTYNMSQHLSSLWGNLTEAGVLERAQEIVFVDDGSTDGTGQILDQLSKENSQVRVVRLKTNQGRFLARKKGAEAAKSPFLFFVDTRVHLTAGFFEKLISKAIPPNAEPRSIVSPIVDIDTSRSLFCLYWDRTHQWIFRNFYKRIQRPFQITAENFEDNLKGTTSLWVERALFVRVVNSFGSDIPLNDDTFLLKKMVETDPIHIFPELRIQWVPRENFFDFLKRMWERGPSFVEYYFFGESGEKMEVGKQTAKGRFFWILLGGLVSTLLWMGILIGNVELGFAIFLLAIFALGGSTWIFAKNATEFFKMLPLHVFVVLVFGVGILRGFSLHLRRMIAQ